MTVKLFTNVTVYTTGEFSSSPGAEAAPLKTDANGGLALDTNVLVVDAVNNRIGINTTAPTQALQVTGNVIASGYAKLGTGSAGAVLIEFNTERLWQFRQGNTGATTTLELFCAYDGKRFNIMSANGTNVFGVLAHNTAGLAYVCIPSGGLRVGADSDPGDNNLTADGTVTGATITAGTGHTNGSGGTTLMRSYSAAGSMIHWAASAIAGSAIQVLPNGSGDVTAIAFYIAVGVTSGGTAFSGSATATPGGGAVNIYSAGGNTLQLTIAADGSTTVARSAGALTYTLSLWLLWV